MKINFRLSIGRSIFIAEYNYWSCRQGWHAGGAHNAVDNLITMYSPSVSLKTKLGTHSKWEYLDGYGVITDPRPQWTQLRDHLAGQGKFEHGWVPTLHTAYHIIGWGHYQASVEDMQLIFGHANNVGANTIFIYVEVPGGDYAPHVLDNALLATYRAGGWVEMEQQKTQAVYCCTQPVVEPTPEFCELFEIQYFNEFRWI